MITKTITLSVCAILMTACSAKKFDCPYKDGVSCKSLSEVNEMVDRGEHGKKLFKKKRKFKEDFINKEASSLESSNMIAIDAKEPIRVPEKIVRIWMAPYESQDGTFHQQTVINAVVMPAHWAEGA